MVYVSLMSGVSSTISMRRGPMPASLASALMAEDMAGGDTPSGHSVLDTPLKRSVMRRIRLGFCNVRVSRPRRTAGAGGSSSETSSGREGLAAAGSGVRTLGVVVPSAALPAGLLALGVVGSLVGSCEGPGIGKGGSIPRLGDVPRDTGVDDRPLDALRSSC